MASDKKIAEAMSHIQAAEKCMKTSFFKWKADLDGASSAYTKAATCFRVAKALSEARDAFIKAAEIQHQMNDPFHAAKSYEQAGLLSKENKEIDMAVQLMERASVMFQEHGTPDTAALTLEKAAKMVELERPDRAVDLYRRACEVAEIENRPRQCAECIGKAARLLIKLQRYDEAVTALKREIDFYAAGDNYAMINRLVIGMVLVQLHRGDYVAARQFYDSSISYAGFGDSEEGVAMDQLLHAYDDGDEEAARNVLSLPLIKYLDNAFAKLARDLPIPGGVKKQVPTVDGGGEAVPQGAEEEEDEFEGGLC